MWFKRRSVILILASIPLLAIAFSLTFTPTQATESPTNRTPQIADNDACFACHATPGLQITLPSGEELYLTVDRDTYNASVHGQGGYACIQCHTDVSEYPHPQIEAETRRDFTLQLYTVCITCHQDKYDETLDSVHQQALAGGNQNAAVCTDCHGAHDTQPPGVPRSAIPKTCDRCHSQIYDLYKNSVHGAALIEDGNPDVPTCTDCHGVHDVEGPSNSPFRLFSPQICAKCHSDPQMMDKYGISTNVFNTYVSDFHGTTVVLFEKLAPNQQTNKPVCIDCHGVHDMQQVDAPESSVMKQNLLATCRKCHPDASANFPSSWLSHYVPSPTRDRMVYYVGLFYKILIPTVVGGMLIFVISDAINRIRSRRKERRNA
jgi:predicted CXXCH cytochrome family protein